MKNQSEWWISPPIEDGKWTIVSSENRLIATFEDADNCFLVVKLFNEKKKTDEKTTDRVIPDVPKDERMPI